MTEDPHEKLHLEREGIEIGKVEPIGEAVRPPQSAGAVKAEASTIPLICDGVQTTAVHTGTMPPDPMIEVSEEIEEP